MICFFPSAGFGTRMKDLTKNIPKPLLQIRGKTLLEINLKFAYSLGISKYVLNTHFMPEKIAEELKKYPKLDIETSHEEKMILGTAGGIKTALAGKIDEEEPFLVINPDSIIYPSPRFRLPQIVEQDLVLYLTPCDPQNGNTNLSLENGKVSFQEGGYNYIGMCVMKLKVLRDIPVGEYADLTDIFKKYSEMGELPGKLFPGSVIDVGDREKYLYHLDISLPDYSDIEI